jgi:septation ring formation regulator EzrA
MYQLPAENNCGGMGSKLPRHLSFSAVDDAIFFNEDDSLSDTESQEGYSLQNALAIEHYKGIKTKEIVTQLRHLEGQAMVWLRQKVQEIEDLESRASRDSEDLDAMYDQKSQEHVGLRQATADLLVEEKGSITEAIREIETLGAKLEYELSALYSKVEDVDDAVAEYERQINDLEGRAKELEDDEVTAEPWLWRVVNFVTGIK